MTNAEMKAEMQRDSAVKLAAAQNLVQVYNNQVFAASLAMVLTIESEAAFEFALKFIELKQESLDKAKELLGLVEEMVLCAEAENGVMYYLGIIACDHVGKELLGLEFKAMEMEALVS